MIEVRLGLIWLIVSEIVRGTGTAVSPPGPEEVTVDVADAYEVHTPEPHICPSGQQPPNMVMSFFFFCSSLEGRVNSPP